MKGNQSNIQEHATMLEESKYAFTEKVDEIQKLMDESLLKGQKISVGNKEIEKGIHETLEKIGKGVQREIEKQQQAASSPSTTPTKGSDT